MKCEEVKENISLYLDNLLDKDIRSEAEEHIETCEQCRNFINQMERTVHALNLLGKEKAPDAVKERLHKKMTTVLSQDSGVSGHKIIFGVRIPLNIYFSIQVAAVLCIVVLAGLFWTIQIGEDKTGRTRRVQDASGIAVYKGEKETADEKKRMEIPRSPESMKSELRESELREEEEIASVSKSFKDVEANARYEKSLETETDLRQAGELQITRGKRESGGLKKLDRLTFSLATGKDAAAADSYEVQPEQVIALEMEEDFDDVSAGRIQNKQGIGAGKGGSFKNAELFYEPEKIVAEQHSQTVVLYKVPAFLKEQAEQYLAFVLQEDVPGSRQGKSDKAGVRDSISSLEGLESKNEKEQRDAPIGSALRTDDIASVSRGDAIQEKRKTFRARSFDLKQEIVLTPAQFNLLSGYLDDLKAEKVLSSAPKKKAAKEPLLMKERKEIFAADKKAKTKEQESKEPEKFIIIKIRIISE